MGVAVFVLEHCLNVAQAQAHPVGQLSRQQVHGDDALVQVEGEPQLPAAVARALCIGGEEHHKGARIADRAGQIFVPLMARQNPFVVPDVVPRFP